MVVEADIGALLAESLLLGQHQTVPRLSKQDVGGAHKSLLVVCCLTALESVLYGYGAIRVNLATGGYAQSGYFASGIDRTAGQ